ncbi:DegT/DnrJ/EryC1/StrS family aminotransferase [candidate division KSB1 bacterium]|nr:DegT/DnrJ/EryC1/StrS family aminotransferase [candidate division KSB1 bacterium]
MQIPFLDLKAQYETIKQEVDAAIQQVIASAAFAGGSFVEKFENEFAIYCKCDHAVGVGSGTDALWLALLGLGIGAGDEVITVPNTFIATAEAISYCGATPVFIDVNENTYNLDSTKLEAAITSRTKAIIPVHLFGQMADMDPIMEIARRHNLFVVEDACQAHGAEYKGCRAGSVGHAGCFSFYPGKNLGAYGEAGAVVTNDTDLATKTRMLRDHGQSRKYYHRYIGWNARMDGIQGAILSVKLKHLDTWSNDRRINAHLYNELLKNVKDVITPYEAECARHVYHVYAIRIAHRQQRLQQLTEQGIHCSIHYPLPIHLQDAYLSLELKHGKFPITEKCADEFLSLPMYAELTKNQIEYVAQQIINLCQ